MDSNNRSYAYEINVLMEQMYLEITLEVIDSPKSKKRAGTGVPWEFQHLLKIFFVGFANGPDIPCNHLGPSLEVFDSQKSKKDPSVPKELACLLKNFCELCLFGKFTLTLFHLGGLFDPLYHDPLAISTEQGLGSPNFITLFLLVFAKTQ